MNANGSSPDIRTESMSKPADSVAKSSMLGVAANGTGHSDVGVGNGKLTMPDSVVDMRLTSSMGGAAVNGTIDEDEEWGFKRTMGGEREEKVKRNCYFKMTQYTTRW
eukprot:CAMPEP_0201594444 /NCGR_PEP_ID=MMETSP0190_2-20130828/191761_1 /ASSEMBLY_ACC=CAM_ASM_000263 /TAXON_ID=37353 /ORGANISM="Rosalina sp." /LENGTH=106 /DNA_ID=CAMNT_0048054063 /DNA_START=1326 /DNA_END=1643 /DNA_ORIENTATION=-